jgi:hypothetical protein
VAGDDGERRVSKGCSICRANATERPLRLESALSWQGASAWLDWGSHRCQSRGVKSCGPSGSQDLAFVCLGPTSSFGLRRPGPDGLAPRRSALRKRQYSLSRRRGSVRTRAGLPGRRGKTRICEMSSSFLLSSDSSRLRRCLSPAATASSAARPSPKRFATGEPRERGGARHGGGRARLPRVAGVVDELTLDVAPVLLGSASGSSTASSRSGWSPSRSCIRR